MFKTTIKTLMAIYIEETINKEAENSEGKNSDEEADILYKQAD